MNSSKYSPTTQPTTIKLVGRDAVASLLRELAASKEKQYGLMYEICLSIKLIFHYFCHKILTSSGDSLVIVEVI